MPVRSAIMTVMTRAAEKAGRALRRDFGEVEQLQVSMKGPADFVSQADRKSEKLLHEELSRARPGYGFVGEEGTDEKGDGEHRWIVDPLDGTTNFLHGIPHWAVSIALQKGGEIVAGVVYDPVKDEMFWGEKGMGAYLNATRLRVSRRSELHTALLATGIPFKGSKYWESFLKELQSVMLKIAGVRRMGTASLDLAYVAAGRYDGYWERGIHPWDVAAGLLLVKEAGGFAASMDKGGDPVYGRSIITTNAALHASLRELLGTG